METTNKNNLLIPISIVIAGVIVAGAVFYTKKTNAPATIKDTIVQQNPEENMKPVDAEDHILGNPNASVLMVEYSDTDCPFCQEFQGSLQKIMDEYGRDGKVAWVYRHFAFHPKAPKEAEATECVAELGGNEKFWQYVDLLFSKKNFKDVPYNGLDPKELSVIAASIGINKTAFVNCFDSGKYEAKVAASYDDAVKSGARGTPYTILVTRNGKIPITGGAIPYAQLKTAIETLLNEKPNNQ